MMSKIEEDVWIAGVLGDLIRNYPNHNSDELSYILSVVLYRREQLETAQVAKWNSNEKKGIS